MAAPSSFADLGKASRDLFSKGFNYGLYKVEAKTKTSSGVEFTASGSSNHDTKNFLGNLETKYKWNDYGITFTEKWNTDNQLATEVSVEDQLVKGLKLSFDTQFVPQTGKKSGKIKTEYKHENIHTNLDVDFNFTGPTVFGAAVVGYGGWLAGFNVALDTAKTASTLLSQRNFAVGYAKNDLTLHWAVKDNSEFTSSVHQKVSDRLETGIQMDWVYGSNDTKFAVAAKYNPDKDTTVRAKLNNATQLALSYQQKVRDGVTLTLSTHIEGKNFSQGGHKFGIGIDFEG
jgi:voltage-dependent anion channel protein 2